jgi:hypothetical protein
MNISVNLDALKNDERETLLRLIGKANKPMKEEFVCIKQRKDKVTWEELGEIIEAGKVKEFFGGKGSISVEMEGVGTVTFDIIGYDAEKLAEDKQHSITLWMRNLILNKMAFSAEDNNKWEESDIRKHINSEEFINRFETGFRELICPVYKDNGECIDTVDRFFLLSKEELEGGYEYIKTEADRVKADKDGETDVHWTRSAYRGTANYTWCVYTSGTVFSYGANWASRFSPACVIAR